MCRWRHGSGHRCAPLFLGHGGEVSVWGGSTLWTLRPASQGVYVSMIAGASIKKGDYWPDFKIFCVTDRLFSLSWKSTWIARRYLGTRLRVQLSVLFRGRTHVV